MNPWLSELYTVHGYIVLITNKCYSYLHTLYLAQNRGKTMYTRLVVCNTCNTWLHGFAWYKSCSEFILCFMMLSLFWATYRHVGPWPNVKCMQKYMNNPYTYIHYNEIHSMQTPYWTAPGLPAWVQKCTCFTAYYMFIRHESTLIVTKVHWVGHGSHAPPRCSAF